jgi:uncharacterized protein YrrD
MRIEQIMGRPVVSIASGTKVGSVHDLLLDDSYLQIAAVGIGGGGLFGGHKQSIAYTSIHGIGPDAVMVDDQDAVQDLRAGGPMGLTHPFDEMRQEVMSESGVSLGRVVEMEFEEQTGAVTSFSYARHEDAGTQDGDVCDVAREDIITITAKMVIVRHSVLERSADVSTTAQRPDRGKVMNQASATAEATPASVSLPVRN